MDEQRRRLLQGLAAVPLALVPAKVMAELKTNAERAEGAESCAEADAMGEEFEAAVKEHRAVERDIWRANGRDLDEYLAQQPSGEEFTLVVEGKLLKRQHAAEAQYKRAMARIGRFCETYGR